MPQRFRSDWTAINGRLASRLLYLVEESLSLVFIVSIGIEHQLFDLL